MIDLEDELGYLEGISENLKSAREAYYKAVNELETLERKIRKHAYQFIIKQSNAQKMQLEFEHQIAQDNENFKRWESLKDNVASTELKLEVAKADWDLATERIKLIQAVS